MDTLIYIGGALKSLDDSGRVGGHLVTFGGRDIDGEGFTEETYFGARAGDGADCLFHHGLPLKGVAPELSDHIFPPLKVTRDEIGLFAETVLNMADEYEAEVKRLIDLGKLGWSSGAPPHMVKKTGDGVITRWPIAEGSFTPTPAEYRHRFGQNSRLMSLKTYQAGLCGTPAVKGLLKDKLDAQTPSWWQFQNVFGDVAKDIALAARSERVTGISVDVEGKIREALSEYSELVLPAIVTQIEEYAKSEDEYFYLKSRSEADPSLAFAYYALTAVKAGRRNSARDLELINRILRAAKELGATEEEKPDAVTDTAVKTPAPAWLVTSGLAIADLELATL